MILIARLLLGLDTTPGSGFLCAVSDIHCQKYCTKLGIIVKWKENDTCLFCLFVFTILFYKDKSLERWLVFVISPHYLILGESPSAAITHTGFVWYFFLSDFHVRRLEKLPDFLCRIVQAKSNRVERVCGSQF